MLFLCKVILFYSDSISVDQLAGLFKSLTDSLSSYLQVE